MVIGETDGVRILVHMSSGIASRGRRQTTLVLPFLQGVCDATSD